MNHEIVRLALVRVFYPCLMIFGTIGNSLCIRILLGKRFRRQSTCQYLCVLAVIDILFISMRSSRYLYRHIFNVDLRNTSMWVCRTFIFFSSSLCHLASWTLVIVSFDRYFIVKNIYPNRHVGWRVFKSTVSIIIVVFLINTHYLYILGDSIHLQGSSSHHRTRPTFVCIVRQPFESFFRIFAPTFDLISVAVLPFLLLTIVNIGIIRRTMGSKMLSQTSRKQRRNNRLTAMLLTVIIAFMLLTCPSVIYICLNRLSKNPIGSDRQRLMFDLLEALWYTKHALNFILYTLTGQDFRREFFRVFSFSKRLTSNSLRSSSMSTKRRCNENGEKCNETTNCFLSKSSQTRKSLERRMTQRRISSPNFSSNKERRQAVKNDHN